MPITMPFWIKVLITIAITMSFLYSMMHMALLKTANSIVVVEIKGQGVSSFQRRRGDWQDCRISGSSYVSSWLTILVLLEENRWTARCVVIVPDNVDADEFRRLRILLRWGGAHRER